MNLNYLGIYPEFFLVLSISFLLGFLVILDYYYNYKFILTNITGKILIVLYLLTFLVLNNSYVEFYIFNNLLVTNSFTTFVKNILIFSLIVCILISFNYVKWEKLNKYEYFILLGLASLGMFTLVSSNDLITMYIAIEIQSLCFYILATIKVYSNFSTEAGLKYFILGAFSSGILLFGCSFIYGSLGTTNFHFIKI